MLSSVYTRHTRTRIFFFSSSCEPCLKNLQGPPLPFWSEWALITSCRLAEAWPWPQSKFKWWSSTTRFKKPRHISVLQLRNQSWNRCHHAEKQTLQGRHTLDELFLLLVGLSKGTFRCQNSIQQQLQTESDQTDTGAMNKERAVPDHWGYFQPFSHPTPPKHTIYYILLPSSKRFLPL